jgi:adenylate kinase
MGGWGGAPRNWGWVGAHLYIVLIGAPGAGKGTQAAGLALELALAHVASGDMFREAMARRTPLGVRAKEYVDRGELVPDEITVGMVIDRLGEADAAQGVILDGFPRTVPQAEALDQALDEKGLRVGQAIYMAVANDELLKRLSGRWLCRQCQASYHEVFNPPAVAGKCDRCGGELYQREDDTIETARRRLDIYFEQTLPIIDYYRGRGVLDEINGQQSIPAVKAAMLAAVARRRPART